MMNNTKDKAKTCFHARVIGVDGKEHDDIVMRTMVRDVAISGHSIVVDVDDDDIKVVRKTYFYQTNNFYQPHGALPFNAKATEYVNDHVPDEHKAHSWYRPAQVHGDLYIDENYLDCSRR